MGASAPLSLSCSYLDLWLCSISCWIVYEPAKQLVTYTMATKPSTTPYGSSLSTVGSFQPNTCKLKHLSPGRNYYIYGNNYDGSNYTPFTTTPEPTENTTSSILLVILVLLSRIESINWVSRSNVWSNIFLSLFCNIMFKVKLQQFVHSYVRSKEPTLDYQQGLWCSWWDSRHSHRLLW